MSRKIVQLKYLGRMDVPDERDGHRDQTVIEELLDLIERGEILFEGWHQDDVLFDEDGNIVEIDNADDDDSPLVEDETIFEVRLQIDIPDDKFYNDDSTANVLTYIAYSLDFRPYHISNCYEREYNEFCKTVIELTIGTNAEL